MGFFDSLPRPRMSRRRFVKSGLGVAAGMAIYAGEIERHWVEVTEHDVHLSGLPASFSGLRIAQLSDIHLDEFTEPFFLRHAIDRINGMNPDMVLLTGDYISDGLSTPKFAIGAAWQCANLLRKLQCRE